MLKDILFPSSDSLNMAPSRKRRQVLEAEDVEMADADAPTNIFSVRTQRDLGRPVILETAKESYLLSPSVLPPSESSAPAERVYELALILETETEVVDDDAAVTESADKPVEQTEPEVETPMQIDQALETTEKDGQPASEALPTTAEDKAPSAEESTSPSTITPAVDAPDASDSPERPGSPTPVSPATVVAPSRMITPPPRSISPSRASPVHSPESEIKDAMASSPSYAAYHRRSLSMEDEAEGDKIALLPTQVLQRNMTANMFRFTDEGVYVLDGSATDGMETEWVIQVKNWKWARGARERAMVI